MGTKLEMVLPKNQHAQRKLLNFENWVNGGQLFSSSQEKQHPIEIMAQSFKMLLLFFY